MEPSEAKRPTLMLLSGLDQKWKITLLCNNCTAMAMYEFPARQRFYGYHPDYIGMDGEIVQEGDWSRVGDPLNSENAAMVFCNNCQLAMLTGAPVQFQNKPPIQPPKPPEKVL